MRVRASIAFIGLVVSVSLFAPGARSAPPAPSGESRLPAALLERLSWSDDPSQLASLLGLKTLHGRPVSDAPASALLRRVPRTFGRTFGRPAALAAADVSSVPDVPIGTDPSLTETRPSVAASPSELRVVVAAYGGFVYPTAPTRAVRGRPQRGRGPHVRPARVPPEARADERLQRPRPRLVAERPAPVRRLPGLQGWDGHAPRSDARGRDPVPGPTGTTTWW